MSVLQREQAGKCRHLYGHLAATDLSEAAASGTGCAPDISQKCVSH